MSKTRAGNFFEDFRVGQEIRHATPRTIGEGDAALYMALTGSRFLQHCSDPFARRHGLPRAPVEDLLAFHIVFGKTVPDISLNAVANLGYADGRFLSLVYPGDTLTARSEVIGLKENSNRQTGVVWVRSAGLQGRRRAGARLCPLGHGPQTRPRGPGPRPGGPRPSQSRLPRPPCRPARAARRPDRPRPDRLPLLLRRLRGGRAHRPRRRHGRSWTASTASPPGSTRTRHVSTSTTTPSARAAWGPASSMAAWSSRWPAPSASTASATAAHPGAQRRHPRQPGPCRRHRLRLVRGAGQSRASRPRRRGCPPPAPGRHQGPALSRLPAKDEAGKYLPDVLLDLDYWVLMPRRAGSLLEAVMNLRPVERLV